MEARHLRKIMKFIVCMKKPNGIMSKSYEITEYALYMSPMIIMKLK